MSTLTTADLLDLHRLLAKTRWLNGVLAQKRTHVFGPMLLGLRSEAVSVVPMFALLKMGILLESIKNGDHRTTWGIATVTDELTAEREGHNHTLDILRNHFLKSTGGNHGRDGNIHWGCLPCRILHFISSDMGRTPNITLAYVQEIARIEYPRLRPNKWPVGVAFFGEGAFQQGGIYEGFNWAAAGNYKWTMGELLAGFDEKFLTPFVKERGVLHPTPFVWIVVNNERSLFANAAEEHGRSDLARRATGFGDMVGISVDADNPVSYYPVCLEAFERARNDQVATLIIANTYRGTGHNQDQIAYESGALARGDFSKVTRIDGVDDLDEFKRKWESEPLKQSRAYLLDTEQVDEAALYAIEAEQERYVRGLAEQALSEEDVTLEEDKKDRTIFPPIDWSSLPVEAPRPRDSGRRSRTRVMGYYEAYRWVTGQLMREDLGVVYIGQDVAKDPGGVLALTPNLAKEFGPLRVWNSPLSEEALIANGAGRSLFVPQDGLRLPRGYKKSKPIIELQFAHFAWDGLVILRVVAPQWYQKKIKFGFIVILPGGAIPGSGEYHESVEILGHLLKMQGIVVLAPSNAYDLVGLMRSAYEYDGPVAIFLQISARNNPEFESEVPLDPYVIPFGKAKIITENKNPQCTVVTIGAAPTRAAEKTAKEFEEKEGIEIDVVDLRTAWPYDLATIKQSFHKTGRLIVFQEDTRTGSIGESIVAALVQDEEVQQHLAHDLVTDIGEGLGFLERLLTTRIRILSSGDEGDIFIPTAEKLVWARLPYERAEEERLTKEGIPFTTPVHRSPKLVAAIHAALAER